MQVNHFMRTKLTRSQRMARMLLPWISEVVDIGEEVTAHEIIGRLTDANGPVKRIGKSSRKGVYRNLKHLPNAGAMSHILKISGQYEKVMLDKVITWRRVK